MIPHLRCRPCPSQPPLSCSGWRTSQSQRSLLHSCSAGEVTYRACTKSQVRTEHIAEWLKSYDPSGAMGSPAVVMQQLPCRSIPSSVDFRPINKSIVRISPGYFLRMNCLGCPGSVHPLPSVRRGGKHVQSLCICT